MGNLVSKKKSKRAKINELFIQLRLSLSKLEIPLCQYDAVQYSTMLDQINIAQRTILDEVVYKKDLSEIVASLSQFVTFINSPISVDKNYSRTFEEEKNKATKLLQQISNELTYYIGKR